VVLERLNIKGMKFKSRRMNRILKASKIGLALEKLKEKLDYKHIRYATVQAAYSSQECSECGEKFKCGYCGQTENADVNAGKVLIKRFGDAELLNVAHFRFVTTILLESEPIRTVLREIGWQQLTVNQST